MNKTPSTTERPKPYIGVSGVVEGQQYYFMDRFALHELERTDGKNDRRIALGVKATHKTQFLDQQNKYGKEWYPVGEQQFANALDASGCDALRVAQTYLDPSQVHDPDYQHLFIQRITKRGKGWLNAVQFDMLPWHTDVDMLRFVEKVKQETNLEILLQAHGPAMQELGPSGISRRLGNYATAIDFILFDSSHGKGERMNPDALKPFLDEAYESDKLAATGIAVAGGLNADIVREVLPALIDRHPDLSWDAEGQLHHPEGSAHRGLDMQEVERYFEASSQILNPV